MSLRTSRLSVCQDWTATIRDGSHLLMIQSGRTARSAAKKAVRQLRKTLKRRSRELDKIEKEIV